MKQTENAATFQSAGNTFYLCEKPSQARTLAKALGAKKGRDQMYFKNGLVIGHAYGHMLTLAKPDTYVGSGKWRLDNLPILPTHWIWQVKEEHIEHFNNLGQYITQADLVVIATDPDEEGEVIGRMILKAHQYSGKTARLWVSALEQESLKKSLKNLRPLSETNHLFHAGRVRHEMDWLFGMNLTRAFSVLLNSKANIGRVKTRLLNEIVNRDKLAEIATSYQFESAYVTLGDSIFELVQPDQPCDYTVDFKTLEGMQHGVYIEDKACIYIDELGIPLMATAPLPYTLTALLADAADKGIPLEEGYRAVQKLYESGAISYPRTNSTQLPGTSDDFAVHHAIVTTMDSLPNGMTEAATQIFELIRLNELCQKNQLRRVDRCQTISIGGEVFSCHEDWTTIAMDSPDRALSKNKSTLANLYKKAIEKPGDKIQATVHVTHQDYARQRNFTEATLLRMMAEKGIGTEATRVSAIASLIKEKLIEVIRQEDHENVPQGRSRTIRSTELGRQLIQKLPSAITGEAMETQLQQTLVKMRSGQSDESTCLMDATKWIANTIHQA